MAFSDPVRKKVHNTWYGILNRRTKNGRGISRYIDPEWEVSFEAFFSEVGPPTSNDSILCLREPEAGFYPGNVYWGKRKDVQQYVSHAHRVFFNGEELTICEAARRMGITPASLRQRIAQSHANRIIGKRVAQLRSERGKSVGDLAAATQIRVSEVRQIEAGEITAGKARLARISAALGVSTESILCGLSASQNRTIPQGAL